MSGLEIMERPSESAYRGGRGMFSRLYGLVHCRDGRVQGLFPDPEHAECAEHSNASILRLGMLVAQRLTDFSEILLMQGELSREVTDEVERHHEEYPCLGRYLMNQIDRRPLPRAAPVRRG